MRAARAEGSGLAPHIAAAAAARLVVWAGSARLSSQQRLPTAPARTALAAAAAGGMALPPPPSASWHSCDSSPIGQGERPGQLDASPVPSPATTVAASPAAATAAAASASPASTLAGSPQRPSSLAARPVQALAGPTPPHLRAPPGSVAGGLHDAYTPWLRSGGGALRRRSAGSSSGRVGGGRQRVSSWLTSPARVLSMTRDSRFEDEVLEAAGGGGAGGGGGGSGGSGDKRSRSSSKGKSRNSSGGRGSENAARATASAFSPASAGMLAVASTEELEEEGEELEGHDDGEEEDEAFGGGRWQTPAGAGRRRPGRQVVLSDDDDDAAADDADVDDNGGEGAPAGRSGKGAGPSASPACWDSDRQEEEAEEDSSESGGSGDRDGASGSSSGSGTTGADTDSTFDAASESASSSGSSSDGPSSPCSDKVGDDGDADEPGLPDSTPAAGRHTGPKQKAPAATPAAADAGPGGLSFTRRRERLARELYAEWNEAVFGGRLPRDLAIVWNPRLRCTAGQVVDDRSLDAQKVDPRSRRERVACRLELSPRVIDRERRLRDTLAHEMAHVAAWSLDRDFERAHGPTFQRWSRAFEAKVADVRITTRHSYGPSVPQQRWACQNKEGCGKVYSRSKMTICVKRHVCSDCRGRLVYLGKFSPDGEVLVAGPGVDATAVKPKRPLNAFGAFVQAQYASTKQTTRGTHAAVMGELSARWGAMKIAGAGGGAGGGGGGE